MILRSTDELDGLAALILDQLGSGSLLLLEGEMGSGKTTFVAALARQLGSDASVSSPTYTLVHEYPTPEGTLVHIDAWRLPDSNALERLGLDNYLDTARLVAVEWGGDLKATWPEAALLRITAEADGSRRFGFEPGEVT